MQKKNAEQTLTYLIALLTEYLTELAAAPTEQENDFLYGEKTAYTECLEIISLWDKAKENGLNFDIEVRFPLA